LSTILFGNMDINKFALHNREEVIRFEELLHSYEKSRVQCALNHLPLIKAYDYAQTRGDGGKLFVSLLDIQINFSMLWLDYQNIETSWNQFSVEEELKGESILDSDLKFFARIDFHRACSSFVLRYRALWDKVMGFLILTYFPEEYKSYENTKKSRKTKFVKIVDKLEVGTEKHQAFKALATEIIHNLEEFDSIYRTPEAHGTGSLRKWSLSMLSFQDNPLVELIDYWNFVNLMISKIGEIFVYGSENVKVDS
jgi:hypothetical protein